MEAALNIWGMAVNSVLPTGLQFGEKKTYKSCQAQIKEECKSNSVLYSLNWYSNLGLLMFLE